MFQGLLVVLKPVPVARMPHSSPCVLTPASPRHRSMLRRGGNVAGRVVVSVAERRAAAVAGGNGSDNRGETRQVGGRSGGESDAAGGGDGATMAFSDDGEAGVVDGAFFDERLAATRFKSSLAPFKPSALFLATHQVLRSPRACLSRCGRSGSKAQATNHSLCSSTSHPTQP